MEILRIIPVVPGAVHLDSLKPGVGKLVYFGQRARLIHVDPPVRDDRVRVFRCRLPDGLESGHECVYTCQGIEWTIDTHQPVEVLGVIFVMLMRIDDEAAGNSGSGLSRGLADGGGSRKSCTDDFNKIPT